MKRAEDVTRNRKQRSDRKRNIQPVISIDLYECMDRIAYITSSPLKMVGETLCMEGLRSRSVIDQLSHYFRRDYLYENNYGDPILYTGAKGQIPLKVDRGDGDRARLSMRLHQHNHDKLGAFAYALDLTIASAASLLLDTAFELQIGRKYIEKYIKEEMLNPLQVERFKRILLYINQEEITDEEPITMSMLFSFLADQAYKEKMLVKSYLQVWIDQYENSR